MARQRVAFIGNQADVQITAFGPAELLEFTPTVNLLAFSFATAAAAIGLRVFYAPAGGAATNNQIEVFNQTVSPATGVVVAGIFVTVIGGQNGCQRAWRDEVTGTVWTLRATVTGLGGADAWDARVEWIIARGVT